MFVETLTRYNRHSRPIEAKVKGLRCSELGAGAACESSKPGRPQCFEHDRIR